MYVPSELESCISLVDSAGCSFLSYGSRARGPGQSEDPMDLMNANKVIIHLHNNSGLVYLKSMI